jgi:hypothetical protein
MEKSFKKFIRGLTVFTLIIVGVSAVLFLLFFKAYYLPVFPVVVLFYYLSTAFLHKYMIHITRKADSNFSFKFMLISFVKMFVYIVFGVLYIIIDDKNAVAFLIFYLLLYVAYAVYEVRSIINFIN